MAAPQPQNAGPGPAAGSPAVLIHNFTSLELPGRLPGGRVLEFRKARTPKDIYPFSILVITPDSLEPGEDYDFLFQHVGVMLWDPARILGDAGAPLPAWVDARLSADPGPVELSMACEHMLRVLELKEQCLVLHNANAITEARNRQLNQVGIALMSERNLDALLNLILEKAMELTGSDAGCLYLVEEADTRPEGRTAEGREGKPVDYWADRRIRFKLTRNGSVAFDFAETTMPPSRSSISGFAMLEGKPLNIPDVYALPEDAAFRHNHGFDATSGYRTRSMLTVPMKDNQGRVVGAIQLINKCRNKIAPITSVEAADRQVVAFNQEDLNLSLSLASQASVAIANAQYERDIQRLFEGFINASVTAIESRDPTTSGHSHRVAEACVRLADSLVRSPPARFSGIRFSETQLRELRYAALLHDFGKIGVREHILTKAKKLFPEEMDSIRLRAEYIKRTVQWEAEKAKVALLRAGTDPDPVAALRRIEEREFSETAAVDAFLAAVARANEPSLLDAASAAYLRAIGQRGYTDAQGVRSGFLKPDELSRLLIPAGTLSEAEREEINSHVTHTWKFLSAIPWTPDLRQVPAIAYAHHEKLDGSGYPRRLQRQDIPLPSRIMAICDIYDALAAADRPYKSAMPPEKALDILEREVKAGKLDGELFRIFTEARIYQAPA